MGEDGYEPSQKQNQTVSKFLGAQTTVGVDEIVEMIYTNKYSKPKDTRASQNRPAHEVIREDGKNMAQGKLREWAIKIVEEIVDAEGKAMSSKEAGFHQDKEQQTWDFIHAFSMQDFATVAEQKGPTILRILTAVGIPCGKRTQALQRLRAHDESDSRDNESAGTLPIGSGKNDRNPLIVSPVATFSFKISLQGTVIKVVLTAYILLLSARNWKFNLFQRIIGIWMFAHTAPYGMYSILSRLGVSSAYTSVLSLLRSLSKSARNTIREKASSCGFLLIYDKINRMTRAWDPDLGQKDAVHSGTAATFVELEDCNISEAFDASILKKNHDEQKRCGLNINVLHDQVRWQDFRTVVSLHCLSMLAQAVPSLKQVYETVQITLRTTAAKHRMRNGRTTSLHPLATTDFDEANVGENAKILDNMILHQLGLSKEELDNYLIIVGGDQATVEKLRALKKFLTACPHGYTRYGWVLPLIQLWHMGWADLERVLSTHWGTSHANDLSTYHSTNVLLGLGRKVKDVKRPDYYPAQHLVFDTLQAEVLDCWK